MENQLSFFTEMIDEPFSTILQEANIGIYTIPECEALLSEEEINDEKHVCIGTPNEAGSCNVSCLVPVVGKFGILRKYIITIRPTMNHY